MNENGLPIYGQPIPIHPDESFRVEIKMPPVLCALCGADTNGSSTPFNPRFRLVPGEESLLIYSLACDACVAKHPGGPPKGPRGLP